MFLVTLRIIKSLAIHEIIFITHFKVQSLFCFKMDIGKISNIWYMN